MIFTRNSHHLVHSTRNVQAGPFKSKQNFVLEMILRLQNWHTKAFDPIPFSFILFSMPEVFIIVLCVCPHFVHRKITTICGYQWKCIAQTTTAMLSGCSILHYCNTKQYCRVLSGCPNPHQPFSLVLTILHTPTNHHPNIHQILTTLQNILHEWYFLANVSSCNKFS